MTLGTNIRARRQAKGLTLAAVADRLGWHKTTVLRYETGALSPRYADLERLAGVLGTDVRSLIPQRRRAA